MSDLVAIVYPTEAKAEEMRTKLFSLQKEYLIELGDAVIAVKHDDGKVKLNQLINTTAAGAPSGGFWGTLVGMTFSCPCWVRLRGCLRCPRRRTHRLRHQR